MAGATSRLVTMMIALLLAAVACGEPDDPKGSDASGASTATPTTEPAETAITLPTASPSPTATSTATPVGWIVLPTQEAVGLEMDAALDGRLIEMDGCLWVEPGYPGYTGGYFLIMWPHGYTASEEDGVIVVRNAAGEVVGREGEEIYMGGGGVGIGSHGERCSGQLWIAGSTVRTGPPPTPHPSAMGTYPPKPAPEEMGALTLEHLMTNYEERSGNQELVVSPALTPEEVRELARRVPLYLTQIDPTFCADDLRNENWYCHPGSQAVLVVVRGDWWSGGVPSEHAVYIGVLYNLNDVDPVPILLETVLSCNGAPFKPILDDPSIPDEEPLTGC